MPEEQIEIVQTLEMVNAHPGYLKKLLQIIEGGVLDVRGDMAEIHFDKDGNIRKIKAPKISIYPNEN